MFFQYSKYLQAEIPNKLKTNIEYEIFSDLKIRYAKSNNEKYICYLPDEDILVNRN